VAAVRDGARDGGVEVGREVEGRRHENSDSACDQALGTCEAAASAIQGALASAGRRCLPDPPPGSVADPGPRLQFGIHDGAGLGCAGGQDG
jgi:hypothetical protein